MGYEVKMFVVTHYKTLSLGRDGYCSVIGMVDLSKPGFGRITSLIEEYQDEFKKVLEVNHPFFIDSYVGDEFKVMKDKYDKYLSLIPAREFLDAMEEDNKSFKKENGATYRRFDMAISLLESIFKGQGWQRQLDKIYVIPYGY